MEKKTFLKLLNFERMKAIYISLMQHNIVKLYGFYSLIINDNSIGR